jgi:hypothetical protein
VPLIMRGASEAAIAMQRAGLVVGDAGDAGTAFEAALAALAAAYDELADRLDDPRRAKDPSLREAVAGLDMAGDGAGRESLRAAVGRYVDAHRADPAVVPHTMALAFGAGWLAYLAHVRVAAEPALDDVVAQAPAAWWR